MDNLMNKYRLGGGGGRHLRCICFNTIPPLPQPANSLVPPVGRSRCSVKSPGHGGAAGCVTRDACRSLRRAWLCGGAGGFARVF